MNFQHIADWLKNTIPGILLLGALGSILAVILLKLINKLFRRWIPSSIQAYFRYEYLSGYKHGWAVGTLINKKNTIGAMAYFSYHSLRMIFALFAAAFFFQFFLILLPASDPILSLGTYLLVFMAFICLRWAYAEYRFIRSAYISEIKPLMDEAIKYKKQEESSKTE